MKTQIIGKNIEVTDAIRANIEKKLKKMDKYLIKYMYEYVAHYLAVGYEMSALWECTIEQQVNSALTRFTDPLLDGIFNYDKLDKILKDKYQLKIVDRKTSQMIKL